MNPLLEELHRHYADHGVPSLQQQAADLMALAARRQAEREAAAIRAVTGYTAATREGGR